MLNLDKFWPKFSPSWWKKIKPFIESRDCYNIYQKLKNSNSVIYPSYQDLWKAFKICEYDELKCVIVGQSPYHTSTKEGIPLADGLCFSCSRSNVLAPSLSVIYDAIEDDTKEEIRRTTDLTYLSMQNILLLNLSLTIDKNNKDSFEKHRILWKPFIEYLFSEVLRSNTGIPFIVFGSPAAEELSQYFTGNHLVKYLKHPAYYARNNKKMEHDNAFTWASGILEKNNNDTIYWDIDNYFNNTLPF